MGCGCFAGDGGGAAEMARDFERDFAKRVFDWVFAGGGGGAVLAASLGLAGNVLGWGGAGAAGFVYKDQGSGV